MDSFNNKPLELNTREVLNYSISYQQNAWSPINKELTINDALDQIKSNSLKLQVLRLRQLLKSRNLDEYNNHKRNLPAVTFSGTFNNERKRNSLKSYNSVIILDVDKLEEDEIIKVKDCLLKEESVFAYWHSPSYKGIKGLVNLQYTFQVNEDNLEAAHKGAFKKLSAYFKEKYNIILDISGSDITRLCFLSYDPELVIKDSINKFIVEENELISTTATNNSNKPLKKIYSGNRDKLYNPKDKNNPRDRNTIKSIIRYLERNSLSITYSYEEWYRTALAIVNTFTYDVGEKYFKRLSALDKEKFNEKNCCNFLMNCYERNSGKIKFNTIIYVANKNGYKTKKQREKGSEAASSQISSSKTVNHLPEDLKK